LPVICLEASGLGVPSLLLGTRDCVESSEHLLPRGFWAALPVVFQLLDHTGHVGNLVHQHLFTECLVRKGLAGTGLPVATFHSEVLHYGVEVLHGLFKYVCDSFPGDCGCMVSQNTNLFAATPFDRLSYEPQTCGSLTSVGMIHRLSEASLALQRTKRFVLWGALVSLPHTTGLAQVWHPQ
jgi:hypothetical protein